MTADSKLGVETRLTRLGRDPKRQHHAVNPPVYHASTLAFDTVAEFEAATGGKFDKGTLYYGRYGTPTTFALEDAVAALEGGYGSIAVPSGLAAVSCALLTFAGVGDHILMTNSVYDPTRQVCDHLLKRLGVETSYYDPLIGAGIAELIRPNTRLVYVESPGSFSFEIQTCPPSPRRRTRRAWWCCATTPGRRRFTSIPSSTGSTFVIHSGTKYIVGHADAMMGLVVTGEAHYETLRRTAFQLGYAAAPDDVYLALRGLRTLSVRLARHQKTASSSPTGSRRGPRWRACFTRPCPTSPATRFGNATSRAPRGLFGVPLNPCSGAAVAAMLDNLELFHMGVSWGGYDSSPLKKALLTGFHSTAKHNATKAVSPSSETMRTI